MPKTILITGAGKNIGSIVAKKFASLGWNVIIHYNSSEKEATSLSDEINNSFGNSFLIKADITKFEEVEKMFKICIEKFVTIDVLINNAGVFPTRNTLQTIDVQQWQNTLDVNLTASLLTSKEFSKHHTTGKIINISSIGGVNIFKNRIDYNISKSALINLTKVLAKELSPDFSVNCVCPGVIDLKTEPLIDNNYPSEHSIPMKRYADINDLFEVIYFFATCSHYITGQVLHIAGGLEL